MTRTGCLANEKWDELVYQSAPPSNARLVAVSDMKEN